MVSRRTPSSRAPRDGATRPRWPQQTQTRSCQTMQSTVEEQSCGKDGMALSIPNTEYPGSALDMYSMLHCKTSSLPKLDKSECPGDDEVLNDDPRANLCLAMCFCYTCRTVVRTLRAQSVCYFRG